MKPQFTALLIIMFFITLKSFGQDLYWTGNAGDDDWFTASNWSPQQVPAATNDVYFGNPPGGTITVQIDDGSAECNGLFIQGTGYTLEMTGTTTLNVNGSLTCAEGNTLYNRAIILVAGDMTLDGYLDNNFGGEVTVGGLFSVSSTGTIDNTGNAVHASHIIAYDLTNSGTISNEDKSDITVTNILTNYSDITSFKFAAIEVQDSLINHGNLHHTKQTDLLLFNYFENQGTFVSEDKAILNGNGTAGIYNYGTMQNIDQSEFSDIDYLYNAGTLENSNKGEFYILQNLENEGAISNDFYIEVGADIVNNAGGNLINTDEIYCVGDVISGGDIDNQVDFLVDGNVNVQPGGWIINTGCFTVNGNVLIDGLYEGSLLNYGSINGSGTYAYNRDTGGTGPTAGFGGWHYISTPVGGMSCHEIFDYYINDWDEANNTWYNYSPSGVPCVAGPDNPFELMKGYSIKRELNYTCNAVNPATGPVVEFAGPGSQVYTGNQSISVSGSDFQPGDPDDMNNWNLVGNPYPSAIDAGAIAFPAEIDNAIYYYNDATLSYESFVGGVGQPFIPVAQGFFVHVNSTGTWNFALDNSTRVCDGSDNWYKSEVSDLITIEVKNQQGLGDKTYYRQLDAASKGFDGKWDAYKLLSDLPEIPQIYSVTGGTRYSINSMDGAGELPLIFKSGKADVYILTARGTGDFDLVYLEDKTMGIFHDLKTKPYYTFTAGLNEKSNRFVLHFNEYAQDLERQGFIIYSKNNCIYLKNQRDLSGEIAVMNSVGQMVIQTNLENGLNRIPLDQPEGIYIVRVMTPTLSVNQKVFYQ